MTWFKRLCALPCCANSAISEIARVPMAFIWPSMLLLLWLIPLLVGFYLRMQLRRRRIVAKAGSLGFMQEVEGRQLGTRRHIPSMLFLIGLAVTMIALSPPH